MLFQYDTHCFKHILFLLWYLWKPDGWWKCNWVPLVPLRALCLPFLAQQPRCLCLALRAGGLEKVLMIEKDFRILRWKCLVSLKCHSLKDYLCVWFGCHLVVFKGKADFRNWSLYPLKEPKWAELKGIWGGCWQLCSGGLLSPLRADSLPGSCRVTLISVLFARLKVGERDELQRREERGNYPAAGRRPPWPCTWMGCVQAGDIQAVGAHTVGLWWVGKWPGLAGGRERQ